MRRRAFRGGATYVPPSRLSSLVGTAVGLVVAAVLVLALFLGLVTLVGWIWP